MIARLASLLEQIRQQPELFHPASFAARAEAIDALEFGVLDSLAGREPRGEQGGGQRGEQSAALNRLESEADSLLQELLDLDKRLMNRLRAEIRQGQGRGEMFRHWLAEYAGFERKCAQGQPQTGFDSLDTFVNELLLRDPVPAETIAREPDMVFYQQTPTRIVLELVSRAKFKPHDQFYDLGSGLGQVPMLVNLLSGVAAKGVECEPAFSAYANQSATALALAGVSFIQQDARLADYADGTVFFMYTPCKGRMLQDVLKKLRADTASRQIKLFTYGPCTPPVAAHGWLKREGAPGEHPDGLALFTSQIQT